MDYDNIYLDTVSQVRFIVERLRLFSRTFLVGYMVMLYMMCEWIMGLDAITSAQTTIASAIVGIGTPLTKFYVDSGENLYDNYEQLDYKHKMIKRLDRAGFVIDKWRLFPLVFVTFYLYTLFTVILWAMGLGPELSNQQASFASIYTGSASFVTGFFISSGDVNLKIEKTFIQRFKHNKDDESENESENESK